MIKIVVFWIAISTLIAANTSCDIQPTSCRDDYQTHVPCFKSDPTDDLETEG
jgi:hypothetical protein